MVFPRVEPRRIRFDAEIDSFLDRFTEFMLFRKLPQGSSALPTGIGEFASLAAEFINSTPYNYGELFERKSTYQDPFGHEASFRFVEFGQYLAENAVTTLFGRHGFVERSALIEVFRKTVLFELAKKMRNEAVDRAKAELSKFDASNTPRVRFRTAPSSGARVGKDALDALILVSGPDGDAYRELRQIIDASPSVDEFAQQVFQLQQRMPFTLPEAPYCEGVAGKYVSDVVNATRTVLETGGQWQAARMSFDQLEDRVTHVYYDWQKLPAIDSRVAENFALTGDPFALFVADQRSPSPQTVDQLISFMREFVKRTSLSTLARYSRNLESYRRADAENCGERQPLARHVLAVLFGRRTPPLPAQLAKVVERAFEAELAARRYEDLWRSLEEEFPGQRVEVKRDVPGADGSKDEPIAAEVVALRSSKDASCVGLARLDQSIPPEGASIADFAGSVLGIQRETPFQVPYSLREVFEGPLGQPAETEFSPLQRLVATAHKVAYLEWLLDDARVELADTAVLQALGMGTESPMQPGFVG
jgi:hypothetical protein